MFVFRGANWWGDTNAVRVGVDVWTKVDPIDAGAKASEEATDRRRRATVAT
jgi:hypothetical protein